LNYLDFWAILAIEPTSDETAIRRAYAAKLKVTNPEDDPEGFKALRLAYDQAIVEARYLAFEASYQDEEGDSEESGDRFDEVSDNSLAPAEDEALDAPNEQDGSIGSPWPEDFAPRPISFPGRDVSEQGELRPESGVGIPRAPIFVRPEGVDEDRRAYQTAWRALVDLVEAGADPYAMRAAYNNWYHCPAMEQIDVSEAAERDIVDLLEETWPRGRPIIYLAIEHFASSTQGSMIGSNSVGSILIGLRDQADVNQSRIDFMERVRKRTHEFNPALFEMSRDPSTLHWFQEMWSLRRVDVVDRFLAFINTRHPSVFYELNETALAFWQKRNRFWVPFNQWLTVGVFLLVTVLSFQSFDRLAQSVEPTAEQALAASSVMEVNYEDLRVAAIRAPLDAALARAVCMRGYRAENMTPPSTAVLIGDCERALGLVPNSVYFNQIIGVLWVKSGHNDKAIPHFRAVLDVSPGDPFAMFGFAVASMGSAPPEEIGALKEMMVEALRRDPDLLAFNDFSLNEELKRITSDGFAPKPVPGRKSPVVDQQPKSLGETPKVVFETARRAVGDVGTDAATARVECMVSRRGFVSSCRVLEEEPLNQGVSDLAIATAERIQLAPATRDGIPVDNVPFVFRFQFDGEEPPSTEEPK
jgi:hypothetical protein